jgi:hypothetical protein
MYVPEVLSTSVSMVVPSVSEEGGGMLDSWYIVGALLVEGELGAPM